MATPTNNSLTRPSGPRIDHSTTAASPLPTDRLSRPHCASDPTANWGALAASPSPEICARGRQTRAIPTTALACYAAADEFTACR